MKEDWRQESEDTLRAEVLRRGEEITYLNTKLEITERRLKVTGETIAELAKYIKEIIAVIERLEGRTREFS